ncbi:PEGA domain-containing protein [Patescibacteria group bacterium]|nr:PEGA domain-containing protein [Patescibacteria group bacterium]
MEPLIVDYRFFRRSYPSRYIWHFLHLLVMVVLIVLCSVVAVFYSMGYKLNLAARTIEQTGILQLGTDSASNPVTVYIDGAAKSSTLPYRYNQVLPGEYSVSIKKNGYQSWDRMVSVEPNMVVSFQHIVLILTSPIQRPATGTDLDLLAHAGHPQNGLEVQNENELWIEGQFITRTSDNITNAQWYPDNQHVVYQAGDELLLADSDGLSTERLLTVPGGVPIDYTFKNNGKILIYQLGQNAYEVTLF